MTKENGILHTFSKRMIRRTLGTTDQQGNIMKQIILEDMLKHMEKRDMMRKSQDGFTKVKLCLNNHGLQQWSDCIPGQGKS